MDFFGNLMQQTCGIQKRTRRWVVWWYGLVVSNPECNMNLHLYACMYVCLFLCPSMFPVFSFEFSSENKNESKNDFFWQISCFPRSSIPLALNGACCNTTRHNSTEHNKQYTYEKPKKNKQREQTYAFCCWRWCCVHLFSDCCHHHHYHWPDTQDWHISQEQ